MSSIATRHAAPALPANAQVTTAQVFALISNSNMACVVSARGKSIMDGRRFRLRAEGNLYTAVGTTTAKPQFLAAVQNIPASPLVVGSWTALSAGTAVASPTTGCPWWIEADLIYDSLSGLMHGVASQCVNNSWTAPAAVTGVLTGINASNNTVVQGGSTTVLPFDPTVWFAVAMTFSVAGAQAANLANFEIQF